MRKEEEMSGMINTQSAAAPIKPSATEQNFQDLSNNLEELADWIHRLGERIQPILREDEPSMAKDEKGYPQDSPVAERLSVLCRKSYELIDRVKYLTGRVDL